MYLSLFFSILSEHAFFQRHALFASTRSGLAEKCQLPEHAAKLTTFSIFEQVVAYKRQHSLFLSNLYIFILLFSTF